MKRLLFALLLFFTVFSAQAQAGKIAEADLPVLKEFEDTLALCGFFVVNDSIAENRFATCKKLITTLVQALKTKNSFNYPFERLKTVSIQYPPDSTFRIFTWQLYVDVDDYRYYGAIQMNTPDLKLFPLIDRSYEIESEESELLTPDRWYGSLYYNLRQFDTAEGRKYLLFGYDGYSLYNKRKLIDVLSFKDGKALFGAPVFVEENKENGAQTIRNRIVKEYSAEASFKLNYDETWGLILFDHLTTMGGSYGQGLAMVPDGTYEGYKLENGRWHWVEKFWTEEMDEAPRPEPVLDTRNGKDLFGKQKKKGKNQ
jgi:hypothetical protein